MVALPEDRGVRDTVGEAVPRGDKEDAACRGHVGERLCVWGRGWEALGRGREPRRLEECPGEDPRGPRPRP